MVGRPPELELSRDQYARAISCNFRIKHNFEELEHRDDAHCTTSPPPLELMSWPYLPGILGRLIPSSQSQSNITAADVLESSAEAEAEGACGERVRSNIFASSKLTFILLCRTGVKRERDGRTRRRVYKRS